MHLHIQSFIAAHGYVGVFLVLLLEMIGIPFPAETTLTVAGFEWMRGVFALFPLLAAAVLGNVLGSTIAYWIGALVGKPILLRYGRWIGVKEARLAAADAHLAKYRAPLVLVAKFIAGIRVLVPYLAGINRMPFAWFTLVNAVGATLWALTFIVAGRTVEVAWVHYHTYIRPFLWPFVAVVVAGVAMWMLRRRNRASRH
ncbi:MAG: DedA family protein [Alicyclobacillus mali]|uniref:DedA family protein n=1 Tax=Alicyclobacillus mali (ex Roth et al. 2021) TaxID=1123961 RepID=UPI0023F2E697|nr:DedA family protein [Alicyclobacillus mali (ex Roth et al. 2021)]MCL6487372.1 DedA family protein [Alicyclobacillus mali (ex Roth et al. 2021)]